MFEEHFLYRASALFNVTLYNVDHCNKLTLKDILKVLCLLYTLTEGR